MNIAFAILLALPMLSSCEKIKDIASKTVDKECKVKMPISLDATAKSAPASELRASEECQGTFNISIEDAEGFEEYIDNLREIDLTNLYVTIDNFEGDKELKMDVVVKIEGDVLIDMKGVVPYDLNKNNTKISIDDKEYINQSTLQKLGETLLTKRKASGTYLATTNSGKAEFDINCLFKMGIRVSAFK